MKFKATKIRGVFLIEIEPKEDERGFFARSFCVEEFGDQGLKTQFKQCSISFNKKRGTLRGMHYQVAPYEETKIVLCAKGALYDVVLDLRTESKTYKQWEAFELSAQNRTMLYVPEGIAHGFQTLEDNTEVHYSISEFYHPECARGIRWDDPAFDIKWPEIQQRVISQKDKSYQDYKA